MRQAEPKSLFKTLAQVLSPWTEGKGLPRTREIKSRQRQAWAARHIWVRMAVAEHTRTQQYNIVLLYSTADRRYAFCGRVQLRNEHPSACFFRISLLLTILQAGGVGSVFTGYGCFQCCRLMWFWSTPLAPRQNIMCGIQVEVRHTSCTLQAITVHVLPTKRPSGTSTSMTRRQ